MTLKLEQLVMLLLSTEHCFSYGKTGSYAVHKLATKRA